MIGYKNSIVIGIMILAMPAAATDAYYLYSYEAHLAKKCPQKHLEMLSPGGLATQVDAFERKQTRNVQEKLDKAANVEASRLAPLATMWLTFEACRTSA